ncbi:hypothetical protein E2C01_032360 [Portunus trituberculatus]|uniref:Uncharacterized protein n=1 Tax=Portunus trituberculatus TaxID=210409 RepID=A0A5B7F2K5_PORTR|nr:hypothetical protein [Portunus trituberculatus]
MTFREQSSQRNLSPVTCIIPIHLPTSPVTDSGSPPLPTPLTVTARPTLRGDAPSLIKIHEVSPCI